MTATGVQVVANQPLCPGLGAGQGMTLEVLRQHAAGGGFLWPSTQPLGPAKTVIGTRFGYESALCTRLPEGGARRHFGVEQQEDSGGCPSHHVSAFSNAPLVDLPFSLWGLHSEHWYKDGLWGAGGDFPRGVGWMQVFGADLIPVHVDGLHGNAHGAVQQQAIREHTVHRLPHRWGYGCHPSPFRRRRRVWTEGYRTGIQCGIRCDLKNWE